LPLTVKVSLPEAAKKGCDSPVAATDDKMSTWVEVAAENGIRLKNCSDTLNAYKQATSAVVKEN